MKKVYKLPLLKKWKYMFWDYPLIYDQIGKVAFIRIITWYCFMKKHYKNVEILWGGSDNTLIRIRPYPKHQHLYFNIKPGLYVQYDTVDRVYNYKLMDFDTIYEITYDTPVEDY